MGFARQEGSFLVGHAGILQVQLSVYYPSCFQSCRHSPLLDLNVRLFLLLDPSPFFLTSFLRSILPQMIRYGSGLALARVAIDSSPWEGHCSLPPLPFLLIATGDCSRGDKTFFFGPRSARTYCSYCSAAAASRANRTLVKM
jgi:hypothetical protein